MLFSLVLGLVLVIHKDMDFIKQMDYDKVCYDSFIHIEISPYHFTFIDNKQLLAENRALRAVNSTWWAIFTPRIDSYRNLGIFAGL